MVKMRYITWPLLALAAMLFLVIGVNEANASPFVPTLSTALSSNAPGATADVSVTYGYGLSPSPTRSFPSSSTVFTPNGWGIPDCSGVSLASQPVPNVPGPNPCPYPMGDTTGSAISTTTFGLLNGACAVNIPVAFPGSPASTGLQNASTDTSDFLVVSAGFSNLIADTDPADGIMDGAEHWNNLLLGLGLPAPRERQVATANLFGTTIWVDAVTFNPGVLAPAALGYSTLVIVENFSPALPASPGLITDVCGLRVTLKQNGSATNLAVHRSNPTASGTYLFFLNSVSQRDADNDGFVNSLDTCPFTTNVGSPQIPGQPANGDDSEASGGDGIDGACDNNPSTFDGTDADGDVFLNRGDNCPQTYNPSQSDVLELGSPPLDGGPRNDSIGDACDLNPTLADGHYHQVLSSSPQCIGSASPFVDSDGDGWCDAEEFVLGSNPGNPASTPESLAVPTTCSDGIDNDGDGATDLADTGCQLTLHDIAWKTPATISGPANICATAGANTATYTVKIRNVTNLGDEPAQLGILINPVPGTNGSGAAVTSVSGGTVTSSGPTNTDGDADVEWSTRVLVTVKQTGNNGLTTVDFTVTFPSCSGGPNVSAADYVISIDLCHDTDIAPLGLFGAGACGAASDGGQDRNSGNDAVISKTVNDQSK